jgi:hypothetical protein
MRYVVPANAEIHVKLSTDVLIGWIDGNCCTLAFMFFFDLPVTPSVGSSSFSVFI